MNRGARAMGNVTTGAVGSNRALSVLKNGMVGLATQATGTSGPLGKLAQGLLLMGGGSTLVLGVAAGIGVIALAYNALTKDAREAVKANDDLIASLGKLSAHGRLIGERQKLQTLQEQLALAERGTMMGGGFNAPAVLVRDAKEIARLKDLIQHQTEAIAFFEREATRQITQQEGVLGRIAFEEERRVAALKDNLSVTTRIKNAWQELFFVGGKSLAQIEMATKKMGDVLDPDTVPEIWGLEKVRLKEFLPPDEEIRQLGISVGRQLAFGLMDGFENMRDVLRSVFMAVLDFALGKLLGAIFGGLVGGPAGAVAGAAGGGGIQGSVVAPASMSLNMNMSGIQPLTAYAVSRDPVFQALLREGLLVARTAGFK